MRVAHAGHADNSLGSRKGTRQHDVFACNGPPPMKSMRTVLTCAALILMLAMGVRQTMGLFLPQMTVANGWTRDEFSFAIALQNLLWGAFVPFAGAIADRYGAGRVLVVSALVYIAGLMLMAMSK